MDARKGLRIPNTVMVFTVTLHKVTSSPLFIILHSTNQNAMQYFQALKKSGKTYVWSGSAYVKKYSVTVP